MKNFYLAVLGIITALAIISGCLMHIGAGFLGKGFSFFNFGRGLGKQVSFGNEVEDIKEVNIDAKVMDIEIKKGDKFYYEYNGREDLQPEISVNDGELKIKQKNKTPKGIGGNWQCNLVIEIPEDAKLGFFKADLNMGNLIGEGFTAEKVDLDLNMGNVVIKELEAKNIEIDADMGNVEIYNADFENIEAEANMGNVIIESVNDLDDYAVDASTSMGDLEVDGKEVSKKYENKGEGGKIKVEANMGNVEIYSK